MKTLRLAFLLAAAVAYTTSSSTAHFLRFANAEDDATHHEICPSGASLENGDVDVSAGDNTVHRCGMKGSTTFNIRKNNIASLTITDSTSVGVLTANMAIPTDSTTPFVLTIRNVLFAKDARIVLTGSPPAGSLIIIAENTIEVASVINNVVAAINFDAMKNFDASELQITDNKLVVNNAASAKQNAAIFTTGTTFKKSLTIISGNTFQHSGNGAGFAAYFGLSHNPIGNTIRFEKNTVEFTSGAGATKPVGFYNTQTNDEAQDTVCLTQVVDNTFTNIDQPIVIETKGGGTTVVFERNKASTSQAIDLALRFLETVVPFNCYVNGNDLESASANVQITLNMDTVVSGTMVSVSDNIFRIFSLSRPLFNCGGEWILDVGATVLINRNSIASNSAVKGSEKIATFTGNTKRPTNFGAIYICGNTYGADSLNEDWVLNMLVSATQAIRFKPMSTCSMLPTFTTQLTTTTARPTTSTKATTTKATQPAGPTTTEAPLTLPPTAPITAGEGGTTPNKGGPTTTITLAETLPTAFANTSARNGFGISRSTALVIAGVVAVLVIVAVSSSV